MRKTWQGGVNGDTATAIASGFSAVVTSRLSTYTDNNTDTGAPATVCAGGKGAISETFGAGRSDGYAASLACGGNLVPIAAGVLTIGEEDTAIACSMTIAGVMPPSRLAPNGTQTALPGTVVFYAHTLTAGSDGQVSFGLTNTAVPSSRPWRQVLYRGTNCSGVRGATALQIDTPVTLVTGQTLCLVVKQFVPAGVNSGAQNTTTLSATHTSAGQSSVPTVFGVTTVSESSGLT